MRLLPFVVGVVVLAASPCAQDFAALRGQLADFVDRRCAHCHDADSRRGGIDFDAMVASADERDWLAAARVWRKAAWRVLDHDMPPRDEAERPSNAERVAFAGLVDAGLRAAAAAVPPVPRAPTLRRLNRVQWRQAVAALCGVEVEAERFLPEDPIGSGFDVVGDVQIVSPLHVESALLATDAVLDAVEATPGRLAALLGEPTPDAAVSAAALQALLRAAFRRPPRPDELATRLELAREVHTASGDARLAARRVLQSVLLAPAFLFRIEPDDEAVAVGAVRALNDHELAVRLAFFLWASPPDAALAARADRGELGSTAVLRAELRRMLADPRARALADEFGAQWLGYRGILRIARDVRRYRFDDALRAAMYEEARLGVDRILREDRNILELLDADWTFVDARLAKHYGLAEPPTPGMQLVALDDARRGGVLGWAATATVTALPLRTSPVLRGRFVLEDLCGDPPPPPPPDVGALQEDDRQPDGSTLRAQLERHRRDARCAACHARLDPFGLVLENFDAIGAWRTQHETQPLDTRVVLASGEGLADLTDLKGWLLRRKDRFVRVLVEKLFTYAIGREPEAADEAVVFELIDACAAAGYRSGALLEALVTSDAFRRRSRS